MKTIEYETTEKKRARYGWSKTGLPCCRVDGVDPFCWYISHERDIPADWPAELRDAVRDEAYDRMRRFYHEKQPKKPEPVSKTTGTITPTLEFTTNDGSRFRVTFEPVESK